MASKDQFDSFAIGRVLYGISLALSASVLSLFLILLVGLAVGLDEHWTGLGFAWWLSLPTLTVYAIVGTVTSYRSYRAQQSWGGVLRVYLLTLVGVVAAWGATLALIGLFVNAIS